MDLLSLARLVGIDWQRTLAELGSGTGLDHEFDIPPAEFLRYAQADAADRSTRGAANAITNAKRAIDCQTDKVLACFGFPPHLALPAAALALIDRHEEVHGKADTSAGLRLLRALNVAPTLLVSRIRQSRHALEHRYERPGDNAVADAIELADLYLRATEHVLRLFQYEVTWGMAETITTDDRRFRTCLYSTFERGVFRFAAFKDSVRLSEELTIVPGDTVHLPLLKLYTAFTLEHSGREALAELLAVAGCPIPPERVGLEIRY